MQRPAIDACAEFSICLERGPARALLEPRQIHAEIRVTPGTGFADDLEHKLDVLHEHCDAAGRDYNEIERPPPR